jgi:putative spermidine/putrescine transport system ATP-binding protein
VAERIAIRNVRKTYGPVVALHGIDLDVAPGEFLALLGPSGSGKTTLLMILAGFVSPDHGSIKFAEREVVAMPPHKRQIGFVFQNYALFPHMTVAENIGFSLRYHGVTGALAESRVSWALELVQLSGLSGRRIEQLSGGQKQRVALARALVFQPSILLMDEPLSALDKKLREQMQIELRQLQHRLGTTTIYVTHDQREALTMANRIAVLNDGAIQQIGTPAEVYERPANRFVASFVGDSQFVKVEIQGQRQARLGTTPINFIHAPAERDGQAYLVLRPEKLELFRDRPEAPNLNIIDGKVNDVIYRGESVLVLVMLAGGESLALRLDTRESTRRTMPKAGDNVWIGVDPEDTVVVNGRD